MGLEHKIPFFPASKDFRISRIFVILKQPRYLGRELKKPFLTVLNRSFTAAVEVLLKRLSWAVKKEINADVVGYLTFAKQDLYDFDPASSSRGFATPRSWSFVSEVLDDKMDATQMTDIVAGAVGEGLAVKFQAHRKIAGQLPNPTEILKGKVKDLKTKEISAMYTLITSMCYELKNECEKAQRSKKMNEWHKMADAFLTFIMDNFETEMVVLGARTALKTYQLPFSPKNLKSFDKFYKRYGSLIVEA